MRRRPRPRVVCWNNIPALFDRSVVLCYHAISDGWRHPLAVRPWELARQVEYFLSLGYRPVGALDVLETSSERRLHVTLDDGYASVEDAVPMLEELGVRASVFVCPEFVDHGACPGPSSPPLPGDERELAALSWDAVRRLVDRGIEVGSHGLGHRNLLGLDLGELEHELVASRQRIQEELQRPCLTLAYPYGATDLRVQGEARRAGYSLAFGLASEGRGGRYCVPRVNAFRDESPQRLRLKCMPLGRWAARGAKRIAVRR